MSVDSNLLIDVGSISFDKTSELIKKGIVNFSKEFGNTIEESAIRFVDDGRWKDGGFFYFQIKDIKRCLFLIYNCEDHSNIIQGKKIYLSLGRWGFSEELLMFICAEFSHSFPDYSAYLKKDDSVDTFENIKSFENYNKIVLKNKIMNLRG